MLEKVVYFFPQILLVAAIWSVALYFLPLKMQKMEPKWRKTARLTRWFVLLPLGVCGLFWVFLCFLFAEDIPRKFSREKWLAEPTERFHMRDDLVKNNFLIGKSKDEIRDLIGPPTGPDSTANWYYDLGTGGHGFGWAFYSMRLHFESEKVKSFDFGKAID